MTYIKKFLPEPFQLLSEYERDPEGFVKLYSKYTTFLGSQDALEMLDEIMTNHKKKA